MVIHWLTLVFFKSLQAFFLSKCSGFFVKKNVMHFFYGPPALNPAGQPLGLLGVRLDGQPRVQHPQLLQHIDPTQVHAPGPGPPVLRAVDVGERQPRVDLFPKTFFCAAIDDGAARAEWGHPWDTDIKTRENVPK